MEFQFISVEFRNISQVEPIFKQDRYGNSLILCSIKLQGSEDLFKYLFHFNVTFNKLSPTAILDHCETLLHRVTYDVHKQLA